MSVCGYISWVDSAESWDDVKRCIHDSRVGDMNGCKCYSRVCCLRGSRFVSKLHDVKSIYDSCVDCELNKYFSDSWIPQKF